MYPVIGLIVGIVAGFAVNFHIPPAYSKYVAVAILAALDSVFGAVTASAQKNFNLKVFITGFFGNSLLAAGLTFLGTRVDVDLGLAAILVFGTRMFNNFAIMRRILLNKFKKVEKI